MLASTWPAQWCSGDLRRAAGRTDRRECVWEVGRGAVQGRAQAEVMGTGLKYHLRGPAGPLQRLFPSDDTALHWLWRISQASARQGLRARALICPGSCASVWAIGYRRLHPSTA